MQFLALNEDGYFLADHGTKIDDPEFGKIVLDATFFNEQLAWQSRWQGQDLLLEPFNSLLVARHLERHGDKLTIMSAYRYRSEVDLQYLCVDEWDRFHGRTTNNLDFVMARSAQTQFFDILDSFDDDHITFAGKKWPTPDWLGHNPEANKPSYWENRHKIGDTTWDEGGAHPELEAVIPKLKLNKLRILIVGCGLGHEAALFAKSGHVVTAQDITPEALSNAAKLYSSLPIQWEQSDVLRLKDTHRGKFDLIVENKVYCALDPSKRDEVLKNYALALTDRGLLLGVFFATDLRKIGPAFGGSEWELRERLKRRFDFLMWNRCRNSPPRRLGTEVLIYAQKK